MTDYYVDDSSGADGNDGSLDNPFKTITFALRYVTSSDTLTVKGSSVTAPYRIPLEGIEKDEDKVLFDKAVNYSGEGVQQGVILSHDFTQGAVCPNKIASPNMDAYYADSTLKGNQIAGDPPLKDTVVTEGAASSKLRRVSNSSSNVRFNCYVSGKTGYVLKIKYQTESAAELKLTIQEKSGGQYWDGSAWGSFAFLLLPNSIGSFSEVTELIDTLDTDNANLRIDVTAVLQTNTVNAWIDELSFQERVETINWTQVQTDLSGNGNVYEITAQDISMAWVCTNADWLTEGIDALRDAGDSASSQNNTKTDIFADILTMPNSYGWENHVLRINLGSDTIENTHIEINALNNFALVAVTADATVSNIHFACGHRDMSAKTPLFIGNNLKFSHGWILLNTNGAGNTSILNDCEISHSAKDGLVADLTATCIANNAYVHDCRDEGVQAINSSQIIIRGAEVTLCGSPFFSGQGGVSCEGGTASLDIKNLTSHHNFGFGVELNVADGSTSSITDSILYGNGTDDIRTTGDVMGFGTTERIHYGKFSNIVTDGVDGNILLTESPFDLAPKLRIGAEAVGAGVRYWTGANPVGRDGEPFSDFDTDIGAVQSKHGSFHPNNL